MFEQSSKFVPLQDKTTQDSTYEDIPSKSSPRKRRGRFTLTAPEPKQRSPFATHRQLVKIAHTVLEAEPLESEMANLVDLVKVGCARWRLQAKEPREITKAIESALFQRKVLRRVS